MVAVKAEKEKMILRIFLNFSRREKYHFAQAKYNRLSNITCHKANKTDGVAIIPYRYAVFLYKFYIFPFLYIFLTLFNRFYSLKSVYQQTQRFEFSFVFGFRVVFTTRKIV